MKSEIESQIAPKNETDYSIIISKLNDIQNKLNVILEIVENSYYYLGPIIYIKNKFYDLLDYFKKYKKN
jgi:hypothetical protein